MADPELRVPWVVDCGRLVRAMDAVSGRPYACPGCGETVVTRDRDGARKHFMHVAAACRPETLDHKTAKRLVEQVTREWLAGARAPTVMVECACGSRVAKPLKRDKVDCAVSESEGEEARRLCTLSPEVRSDAVLLRHGRCVLAIEIRAEHAVPPEKARMLNALGVAWLELDASAIVRDPLRWTPIAPGTHSRHVVCDACERFKVDYGDPGEAFRRARYACWKCRAAIFVFTWEGHGPHSTEEPPASRPATLRLQHSNAAKRSYWMNTCPDCEAPIGDNYLYGGDGVFPGVITEQEMMAKMFGLGWI